MRIIIGEGSCGLAAGAKKVFDSLSSAAAGKNYTLGITGCIGMCFLEPIVDIYEGKELLFRLVRVREEDGPEIIRALENGDREYLDKLSISAEDKTFLERQTRIVLRNCGITDPGSIDEYISTGGYSALKKVLSSMTQEEVIEEIKRSGLAGRGGAGFPTWFKWNAALKAPGKEKYIICNADEGDPGAFMDRAVIEGDPHSLIEGMMIGAYATGSSEAIVYVRAEYPLAIKRLETAIEQAESRGFTGKNILCSDFSCSMKIRAGAGAFVCGEETALIESLEGKRGMPRLKPPFPAEKGFRGRPSNINNVETFANVAWIISRGGEKFASYGIPDSRGTKVFALTGKIKRGGLVEVPMGMTLRQVIFDIGGGIRDGRKFKAVQLGGPSGGCLPESLLDTVIGYKSLAATGAIMGSGGMVVMDDSTCITEMARFFLEFTTKESCGKCVHCRLGTKKMLEILNRITDGKGQEGDTELLEEMCLAVKDGALCGLGQSAPNPVLSAVRYFRSEFDAHIKEKRCPAGQCTALLTYAIDPQACTGCVICSKKCPAGAIHGKPKTTYAIDQDRCIKCGMCRSVCKFNAVTVNGKKK